MTFSIANYFYTPLKADLNAMLNVVHLEKQFKKKMSATLENRNYFSFDPTLAVFSRDDPKRSYLKHFSKM